MYDVNERKRSLGEEEYSLKMSLKIIDEELLAEKVKEFPPLFEKAKKGYKEKNVVINPFTTMGIVNDPLKNICSYARAVCSLRLIFRKYSPKVSAFQETFSLIR